MQISALAVIVLALSAGMIFIALFIAMNRDRYLTRFDIRMLRPDLYLRSLPNFLQALHDHDFARPWPRHVDAISAAWFTFQVRRKLHKKPLLRRRSFLHQHFVVDALRETLHPYIHDYVLAQQIRIVTAVIVDMEDTSDRDRLVDFLTRARAVRTAFANSLTSYDHQMLSQMRFHNFFATLHSIHTIFLEHGFAFMPELDALRRWAELPGSELAHDLPALPVPVYSQKTTVQPAPTRA